MADDKALMKPLPGETQDEFVLRLKAALGVRTARAGAPDPDPDDD